MSSQFQNDEWEILGAQENQIQEHQQRQSENQITNRQHPHMLKKTMFNGQTYCYRRQFRQSRGQAIQSESNMLNQNPLHLEQEQIYQKWFEKRSNYASFQFSPRQILYAFTISNSSQLKCEEQSQVIKNEEFQQFYQSMELPFNQQVLESHHTKIPLKETLIRLNGEKQIQQHLQHYQNYQNILNYSKNIQNGEAFSENLKQNQQQQIYDFKANLPPEAELFFNKIRTKTSDQNFKALLNNYIQIQPVPQIQRQYGIYLQPQQQTHKI